MTGWAALADEIAAFVLSASCAGCDAPGTLLCDPCRHALVARPVRTTTPEGMPVVAALAFDGVAARCIRRLKEEGETLLARPLGAALGEACAGIVTEHPTALPVPVPTGRAAFRRRGYRVPELLIRQAGQRPARLLAPAQRTEDQRGLALAERRRNVTGSMRVRRARQGRDVLVFDDVVTTGATLDEAARVLTAAGFRVCGAVALAATPRRRKLPGNTS
ncbi:ComF family protein [Microbacterium sp.]|uniref:ComF family protein n=1 Tax=Microbacterium sp. TaxID=51671 RepID=UPI003F98EADE